MPFDLSPQERRSLEAIADTLICSLTAEQTAKVMETTGHRGDGVERFLRMSGTESGVVDMVPAESRCSRKVVDQWLTRAVCSQGGGPHLEAHFSSEAVRVSALALGPLDHARVTRHPRCFDS